MATTSWCLSAASPPLAHPQTGARTQVRGRHGSGLASCSSGGGGGCQGVFLIGTSIVGVWDQRRSRPWRGVVCMAPDEEKMTRRSPLDFPIEWERPKPGRRPDIFPQFSPMKTPLPPPLPEDPPEEDEDEDEEEKKEEEEEEDPDKKEEEDDKPNKPKSQGV